MLNKIYNKNSGGFRNIIMFDKKIIIAILIIFVIILAVIFTTKNNETVEVIEKIETGENVLINESNEEVELIIIHIVGCVKNQGIVEVANGSRIIDVIEAAGGVTEEADINKVNLAYLVKDAQKIYIPSIYDEENIEYITMDNGENVIVDDKNGGKSNMININTATQTELEQLPGIGPSTALKIINYREENKKFNSIEEIKEVPGIGDAKFNNIKDMIEV